MTLQEKIHGFKGNKKDKYEQQEMLQVPSNKTLRIVVCSLERGWEVGRDHK